ncbi:xanthine dehydrogenase family protein molybdopterin-binding subunit [Aquabacter sp. L1I39]|uniref:xanthine dehydrogenase family protein molybdopterin-binding subunit n=1 Tax=Aquabacter sp. L1I39 TaxID=2820278 RepID=UPI001ADB636B|nr:xanthine dehydrogenase family protein molybdopterin-binding subunit [Aquabacter sp. L1I39]QTL03690.1 xanthine dehydrogenase family protein molybdopterin-binding subunit [Aquabacter sp. L1I39]
MTSMKFGHGQPYTRLEDPALLTGAGHFVADAAAKANAAFAYVVRSPYAHARFEISGREAVEAMPGVRLVLTGDDVADCGSLPVAAVIAIVGEARLWKPDHPILAKEVVRHVGEPLAFIVADTADAARDAGEALEISWDPLPAIADLDQATTADAPQVWPQRPGNVAFTSEIGDEAATNAAFAEAAHVVRLRLVNNRVITNYMETRGVLAEVEESGRVRLTLGSQGSHLLRNAVADKILKWPREDLRVVTPDVGGGFGTKMFPFPEYPLAALAARRLNAPLAWIGDRSEHFQADTQGRDNITEAELALDADGRFLALRVETSANMGAYLAYYGPFVPVGGARMLPGVYDIKAVFARIRGIYTHTVPVDAYRGAGRPEAAYVIERLVDAAARQIGLPPEELRRRNFIAPSAMPYATATGRLYDSGEFDGHMTRALERADHAGFAARAEASKARGLLRGFGFATYIEACGGGLPEPAFLRLDKDGAFTLRIGSQSSGQGHKTAYAHLAAAHLKVPLDRVRVLQGDTDDTAEGHGTGGSRSIPVGGAAVAGAARRLAQKLRELGADALEADPGDIELVDGGVEVAGTDRRLDFSALAALPEANEGTIAAQDAFAPPEATYPNGTHACEVEIDPLTGEVRVVSYTVVDDFGAVVTPTLLEGQVQGGIAQGLGQALLERTVFDSEGQLLTASFMDYALPRAQDIPPIHFETRNVPCTTNPLGVKGAGEAGTIGACPAVMNAVVDALHRACGIAHLDMPATPLAVREAIAAAQTTQ